MTRKHADPKPLTTQRLAELAEIIADEHYEVGPQDERDVIEALRELVERRNAEALRERSAPTVGTWEDWA